MIDTTSRMESSWNLLRRVIALIRPFKNLRSRIEYAVEQEPAEQECREAGSQNESVQRAPHRIADSAQNNSALMTTTAPSPTARLVLSVRLVA